MADKKVAKVAKIFYCEICDYKCSKKFNFDKHLSSLKHKSSENADKYLQNTSVKVAKVAKVAKVENGEENDEEKFYCICGRSYKHRQSLFKHQTKCTYEEPQCEEVKNNNSTAITGELVLEINKIVVNSVQTVIKELAPQLGNNNNNTNNNTNNFNINVFLNEQCKDAMNMSDFIKSIEVSLEQLDFTTYNGLEKGITKVIMENMSNLSVNERPIHCTDTKRDTLYIKDNDKWEKDKDKSKIKHIIKKTSSKNYEALRNWTDANPDFMDSDDKQRFYAHSISKLGKPICDVEDKIIKTICNNTYIKDDL